MLHLPHHGVRLVSISSFGTVVCNCSLSTIPICNDFVRATSALSEALGLEIDLILCAVVEMTEKLSIPDFVNEADALFAGVAEEYSALEHLAVCLLTKQEADGLERTVLLQCGIAWQHYHAILLLLANRLGVQGLVLCRTLFELVVATLYLVKNPGLLTEFLDYGKLVFYKHALAVGLSESDLAPIKPECENIRSRFARAKRRAWHGSKIDRLAEAVGLGEMYKMFYPDAFVRRSETRRCKRYRVSATWNH